MGWAYNDAEDAVEHKENSSVHYKRISAFTQQNYAAEREFFLFFAAYRLRHGHAEDGQHFKMRSYKHLGMHRLRQFANTRELHTSIVHSLPPISALLVCIHSTIDIHYFCAFALPPPPTFYQKESGWD